MELFISELITFSICYVVLMYVWDLVQKKRENDERIIKELKAIREANNQIYRSRYYKSTQ